jgi:hypothetical protein
VSDPPKSSQHPEQPAASSRLWLECSSSSSAACTPSLLCLLRLTDLLRSFVCCCRVACLLAAFGTSRYGDPTLMATSPAPGDRSIFANDPPSPRTPKHPNRERASPVKRSPRAGRRAAESSNRSYGD